MWEPSFVAVSVLLAPPPHASSASPAASVDEAMAALPEGAELRAAELASKLRDPRRAVRAQGLAVIVQEIALAIGEVTLR